VSASRPRPVLLVSVGTDHHPFDRLVGWVDAWVAAAPDRADCLVQYGTSRPPAHARGTAYLGHDELAELMRRARVVVCHGGPSTIVEARRHGHRPIVVPRSPELGEHVDDHQQRFTARLADRGLVRLAGTAADLGAAIGAGLDLARAAPGRPPQPAGSDPGDTVAAAALRFGELVDAMLAERSARRR
jgi:UDP-N-acetylglucosamine transferase subunit ALG13